MADDLINVPNFHGLLTQIIEGIIEKLRRAVEAGTAPQGAVALIEAYDNELANRVGEAGAEAEGDGSVEPYQGVDTAAMLEAQEQGLIQALAASLYDMASRLDEGGALTRQDIDRIIEETDIESGAELFPFALGLKYDLRRDIFELTSANGVWIPYQGLNPIAGTIDWNLVTSFDFLLRGASGYNYYNIFNAPAMRTFPRAIGIRQRLRSGDANVVVFETTGPTVFPGVNAPPFINQAGTITTGTTVPGSTQGMDGDLFIKRDTGTLYVKVGGLWLPRIFEFLATVGNILHVVMAPPDAALGGEGDVAIVLATGRWWRKEAAALWREQRGLKAPLNVLPTPTYATIPVRRMTVLDSGTPNDIVPPIGTEYPLLLVLASFTTSGRDGMDGVGFEELRAVSAVSAEELQPSQLPSDARGYRTTVSVTKRLYRVAAVTDVGQGPFTDPVRVSS